MNTGSNPETAILLKTPEAQGKLIELRDGNEHSSWETIRDKFNDEYETNVSLSALKSTYNKCMATSVTVSGPAKNHFEGMVSGMSKRMERIQLLTDMMANEYEKAINFFQTSCELSEMERSQAIMELIPQLDKLNTTFMKQIKLVSDQVARVSIEQKKEIWDDSKVKAELDRLQPLRLQVLEQDQRIAIIDRSLLTE